MKNATTKKDQIIEIVNALFTENSSIETSEVKEACKKLECSDRTVTRTLAAMKADGKLVQDGTTWTSLEIEVKDELVTVVTKTQEELAGKFEIPIERSAEENKKINSALDMAKKKFGIELSDFPEINFGKDSTLDILSAISARIDTIDKMEIEIQQAEIAAVETVHEDVEKAVASAHKEIEAEEKKDAAVTKKKTAPKKKKSVPSKKDKKAAAPKKKVDKTKPAKKKEISKVALKIAAKAAKSSGNTIQRNPKPVSKSIVGAISKKGVIQTIIDSISKKALNKAEILKVLVKNFPNRDPEKMKKTIMVQVPFRLRKEKNMNIKITDGRYFITK